MIYITLDHGLMMLVCVLLVVLINVVERKRGG